MDEALYMARDVVECMYEETGVIIELVAPPDVITKWETQQRERAARRMQKKKKPTRSFAGTRR